MISYTEENIQRILQNLKENIREKKFSSSKFPLFVFICGEQILDENSQIMAAEDLRSKKNKRQYILDAIDEIKNRKVVGYSSSASHDLCAAPRLGFHRS